MEKENLLDASHVQGWDRRLRPDAHVMRPSERHSERSALLYVVPL
jgi:hypothetical protein